MIEKIKISHECPLSLLDESLKWNDYQYILPHLIDKYPKYKEFMLDYRQQDNSFIIMDNGLFEGVEHTEDDLFEKIELINPDIFIVPDAWNDAKTTYKNAANYAYIDCELTDWMVVLQGETFEEMKNLFRRCYNNLGYRHFAINFSSIAYQNEFPHKNKLISQMMGRVKFIHHLHEYIAKYQFDDLYIHLLGCSLPQEFIYYKDYSLINSIDSSNPIIMGALGNRYEDYGSLFKPEEKIEIFMEKDLENQYSDIKFNIHKFRSFIHSKIPSEHILGQ